jgi:hypothetical protein
MTTRSPTYRSREAVNLRVAARNYARYELMEAIDDSDTEGKRVWRALAVAARRYAAHAAVPGLRG